MKALARLEPVRRVECPLTVHTLEGILEGGLGARVQWLAVSDGPFGHDWELSKQLTS